jgi:hypothetical protein
MAALVERDDVDMLGQPLRNRIPFPRIAGEPVEEQHGPRASITPAAVMKAQPVQHGEVLPGFDLTTHFL